MMQTKFTIPISDSVIPKLQKITPEQLIERYKAKLVMLKQRKEVLELLLSDCNDAVRWHEAVTYERQEKETQ